MSLRIQVPAIRCNKTTSEWGRDEIYYLVFVSSGDQDQDGNVTSGPIFARASEVEGGVSKGEAWKPRPNDFHVDHGERRKLVVGIALYERDDARVHRELLKKAQGPIDPEDFEWPEPEIPDDPGKIEKWIPWLLKTAFKIIKHFRKDDYFGAQTIAVDLDQLDKTGSPIALGPHDLRFRELGGDYSVRVDLSLA